MPMSDRSKIDAGHQRRTAYVYLRQSTAAQVEHNRESTDRQYALAGKAVALGWAADQVSIIDEDLGISGSGLSPRSGFARLTAEVALGHVGIVLGLEVSRLARNNADWYRLIDLCGVTDTLIGDADGVYHPANYNDRLLLGLKGTMSEAELHILRARLLGGIRNKAARGELRRGLPVGFVWGEADGEVCFHPDEAVTVAIHTVFTRFAELGSARRVWLWFRSEGLSFPLQTHYGAEIRWIEPSYSAVHHVLTNPVYAGAYVYGKSRCEITLDPAGMRRNRVRKLPPAQWAVFIPGHHAGFIDWQTYEANRARIASNTRPRPHQPGGAVREGSALLQGLATCGHCGRKLRTHYRGRTVALAITAPGRTSSTVAGRIASMSAACRSMTPSAAPSSPPWLRQGSRPHAPRPNDSQPIVTRHSPSGGLRSSVRPMRRSAPSVATRRSMPRTVWSHAASRLHGSRRCVNWTQPRPSWPAANGDSREPSAWKSANACSISARISRSYGTPLPQRRVTARSCCAPSSKR
jgi:DNA invertase Pin-like site-specific DNA recombinase